jgi:hypothetical protein
MRGEGLPPDAPSVQLHRHAARRWHALISSRSRKRDIVRGELNESSITRVISRHRDSDWLVISLRFPRSVCSLAKPSALLVNNSELPFGSAEKLVGSLLGRMVESSPRRNNYHRDTAEMLQIADLAGVC